MPGRVVYLNLSREQKAAFRDADGQLALNVVRHLLPARAARIAPGTGPELDHFPLTELAFTRVALRLGRRTGVKTARRLLLRLTEAGVLQDAGSYRQHYDSRRPSGWRVRLFKLAQRLRSPHRASASIGSRRPFKPRSRRRRWWQHPLFGDHEGRAPPIDWMGHLRSNDEDQATWR